MKIKPTVKARILFNFIGLFLPLHSKTDFQIKSVCKSKHLLQHAEKQQADKYNHTHANDNKN